MNNHITIQRQLLCCLFRENRSMNRENFQSRLGFILVSAGCAIGIGNVWRFPYVAGQNGGGVFVLFYLIFLLCMGVPVLTMELAVGRAGKKSAVQAYKALEKDGQKWHIHGWFCMIGCAAADDVLYNRIRLDAELLCQIHNRQFQKRNGCRCCRRCLFKPVGKSC